MEGRIAGKPRYGMGARIMYGACEFFGGGGFLIISSFFTVFLVKALGIPPSLAGTIPLWGHVWDAVTDPVMGNITDRTVSPLGAKRFYILIGGIASGLTFVAMWVTVPTANTMLLYLFYMLMYILFSTGLTIVMVPYNGLLPDMIDDYTLRAQFSNVRMVFSTIGAMVCGLVPAIIISDTTDKAAYLYCAILFGVIFFVVAMVTFAGTWEKLREPVRVPFSESFTQAASVFRSRSFALFIGLYLFGQCGMDFISGMAIYYIDDVLNGYDKNWFTYMLGVLMVCQLLGMALFGTVMTRVSKRAAILTGAPIRLAGILGLLAFSREGTSILPVLVLSGLVGLGNAASLTGIFAVMADMTDIDELITSIRRPGIVSGMATFARKVSSGTSVALIGFLLSAVGYDEVIAKAGGRQAASTQQGIALVYVIAPALLTVLLIVTAVVFPVAKKEFAVVQTEIARRRGEDNTAATEEEKRICEKVTGMPYARLWLRENATVGTRKSQTRS